MGVRVSLIRGDSESLAYTLGGWALLRRGHVDVVVGESLGMT